MLVLSNPDYYIPLIYLLPCILVWSWVSIANIALYADECVKGNEAMSKQQQSYSEDAPGDVMPWPIMICLLGNFRLLANGRHIATRAGGKSEAFLSLLALHYKRRISREQILQSLWPEREPALARNSLHNLVHHLNTLLDPALQDSGLVLHEDGYYRLNAEAGVGVDVIVFDHLVAEGDQQLQRGDTAGAVHNYDRAIQLYRDDIQHAGEVQTIMERERLRARYLTLLAQLAEYNYKQSAYGEALTYLWQLLARDAYREDAHRLVMCCYVRRGERAAALHHYQICVDLLRTEFDAPPEAATVTLFNQIRFDPEQI